MRQTPYHMATEVVVAVRKSNNMTVIGTILCDNMTVIGTILCDNMIDIDRDNTL